MGHSYRVNGQHIAGGDLLGSLRQFLCPVEALASHIQQGLVGFQVGCLCIAAQQHRPLRGDLIAQVRPAAPLDIVVIQILSLRASAHTGVAIRSPL